MAIHEIVEPRQAIGVALSSVLGTRTMDECQILAKAFDSNLKRLGFETKRVKAPWDREASQERLLQLGELEDLSYKEILDFVAAEIGKL
jgi:hypothetical protein